MIHCFGQGFRVGNLDTRQALKENSGKLRGCLSAGKIQEKPVFWNVTFTGGAFHFALNLAAGSLINIVHGVIEARGNNANDIAAYNLTVDEAEAYAGARAPDYCRLSVSADNLTVLRKLEDTDDKARRIILGAEELGPGGAEPDAVKWYAFFVGAAYGQARQIEANDLISVKAAEIMHVHNNKNNCYQVYLTVLMFTKAARAGGIETVNGPEAGVMKPVAAEPAVHELAVAEPAVPGLAAVSASVGANSGGEPKIYGEPIKLYTLTSKKKANEAAQNGGAETPEPQSGAKPALENYNKPAIEDYKALEDMPKLYAIKTRGGARSGDGRINAEQPAVHSQTRETPVNVDAPLKLYKLAEKKQPGVLPAAANPPATPKGDTEPDGTDWRGEPTETLPLALYKMDRADGKKKILPAFLKRKRPYLKAGEREPRADKVKPANNVSGGTDRNAKKKKPPINKYDKTIAKLEPKIKGIEAKRLDNPYYVQTKKERALMKRWQTLQLAKRKEDIRIGKRRISKKNAKIKRRRAATVIPGRRRCPYLT